MNSKIIHQHLREDGHGDVELRIGREELLIHNRYQVASILNDFLIGIWFLVGSVAFFDPKWETFGVWLFVIGSAQLILRPAIRLARSIHLQRLPESGWDM